MTTTAPPPRTKREAKAALGPYGRVGNAINELDERLGVAKGGRVFLDKIFPDHWSFMLGEIALYSFVVLMATGVFLTLYFIPSSSTLIYHCTKGQYCYLPLVGQKVSEAYNSTVSLSFDVRAGLLMRQMHHWAADVFIGSIVVHMGRIFFTGAFRKPRETNWVIGTTLLILAILEGFIGYSLPDDLISGTGLRIGYSIVLSIPVVGTYLATFLFGGNFPGSAIIPRFFTIHVLIIPIVMAGLIGAHLGLLVRQKHTQFPGRGKTEHNVVGSPMFPTFMAKTTGFLFMISGGLALLGGLAQINPIWQFGSYQPDKISYAVQPDWYMGWLDGALRIMPSWETVWLGHTIPWEVFIPAVIFPGIIFNIAIAWPMIERKLTNDNELHNLLDRPSRRPKRTAFGVAFFTLLAVLFAASSTDVLANYFNISLNAVLWAFRILVFVVPVIAGSVTYAICLEMQHTPGVVQRKRAVVVRRSATGEYTTVPTEPRPGDTHEEPPAIPVPVRIDLDDLNGDADVIGAGSGGSEAGGVRRVAR
jgi:ubiquinol-cytochrome c reductase cytochrome b subunit